MRQREKAVGGRMIRTGSKVPRVPEMPRRCLDEKVLADRRPGRRLVEPNAPRKGRGR